MARPRTLPDTPAVEAGRKRDNARYQRDGEKMRAARKVRYWKEKGQPMPTGDTEPCSETASALHRVR